MRVVQYIITVVIILCLNFFLPRLMPGDPISTILNEAGADSGLMLTEEARAELLAHYGLDLPLDQQLLQYVEQLLHGDLGWSIRYRAPVADLLASRVLWTVGLVMSATLIAALLGTLLGVTTATHHGRWQDSTTISCVMALGSWPSFVVGVLLILVFAVWLGWLPIGGGSTSGAYYETDFQAAGDIIKHGLLPCLSLIIVSLPGFFMVARTAALCALQGEYIQVARAKGLAERRIVWRHIFPNALLPVVTALAMRLGYALTGAMAVEVVFQYPGMGTLIYEAAHARDYALLQGTFLLIMLTVLTFNLLAEMLYHRLDPRLRRS